MSHRRRLARTSKKAEGAAAPEQPLSATLFAFAKPMLDTMPVPRKLAHVKAAMALATLAWNLPLLERREDPVAAQYRSMVDAELASKPAFARDLVLAMMKDRVAQWGDDQRLVASVEVLQGEGGIQVLATEGAILG